LGEQPLANALRTPGDTSEEFRAPLSVVLCENCGLSQLTVVVDPEILYKGYRFRSGTSEAWRKHCVDLAEQCGDGTNYVALEIASNDGTMLDALSPHGWRVMGVDPEPWHPSVQRGYWTEQYARDLGIGNFELVIAQNVLGHVDDPIDFLKGIKAVLAEDGQAVIEVPNVGNLIDDCAFDTIYHEHLTYWNGIAVSRAARQAGLSVRSIERLPNIHGGSVRYWLEHGENYMAVYDFLPDTPYVLFGQRVAQHINKTAHLVDKASRKKFIGWGASAKGAIYLNALNNRWPAVGLPEYVIDETKEKQGLLMPGVRLPIVAPPDDLSDVDVIWVTIWNWLGQVKEKARARGFEGRFLITSPRPELIE
jgi:novobiocin biosynthesis protein NovU/D-mycarose 3-C-methyltransferase